MGNLQRPIRFRVWDFLGNKMHYPDSYSFDIRGIAFQTEFGLLSFPYKYVMQYTGLKDKSGREIYEGDRTKRGDTIRIIEFDNGGFFARLDKGSSGELSVPLFLWVHNTEIIGNIYE